MAGVFTGFAARGAIVLLICLAVAPLAPAAFAVVTFALALWVGYRAQRDRARFERLFYRPGDRSPPPAILFALSGVLLFLRAALCAFLALVVMSSLVVEVVTARSIAFASTTFFAVFLVFALDRYTRFDGVRVSYFGGPLFYGAVFYALTYAYRYRPAERPDPNAPPPPGSSVFQWMTYYATEARNWVVETLLPVEALFHLERTFKALTALVATFGGLVPEKDLAAWLRNIPAAADTFREANVNMQAAILEVMEPVFLPIVQDYGVTTEHLKFVAFFVSLNIFFGYVIATYVAFWFGRASKADARRVRPRRRGGGGGARPPPPIPPAPPRSRGRST